VSTTLLDRIRRDQFGPEHDGDLFARGWNARGRHIASILGTSIDALAGEFSSFAAAGACLDGAIPTVGGSQGPTSLDMRVKERLVTP
jgi:hypothetical protein